MSDIDNCGTIFCIYRKNLSSFRKVNKSDLLQSGELITAAGYLCMVKLYKYFTMQDLK